MPQTVRQCPRGSPCPYGVVVPDTGEEPFDLRDLLAAVEAALPVDAVDVLARELARTLDATDASLLVPNMSGTAVVRMSHVATAGAASPERRESVLLDGSAEHRALVSQEQQIAPVENGWHVLTPVTERGDAVGILELVVPARPDEAVLRHLRAACHALAFTIIAARRHTDIFERAQRDIPFSLAAEIQRRLLPPSYTVEAGPFTLAGWLEPAASVGGDTFDYSVDRKYLYASITDAMGHSTHASLLATLALGSLRNTRRSGASPSAQADAADAALLADAPPGHFVTGHLARIRLSDGAAEIVNAGHPLPYLLRDGVAAAVELAPDLPLGLGGAPYSSQLLQLRRGDRLLIVTDGFLERNAISVAIGETLEASAARHPREVVRELAQNVLSATGGDLKDDATALCIDWLGARDEREARDGASLDRATNV